jgi:lipid-binding SYLF domain-containing protein
MKNFAVSVAAVLAFAAPARAALKPSDAERLQNAARIVQEIRSDIPQDYWDRARCAVVIPDLKKAAFIFGGEFGKGAMSCRAGETWSAPVFMQLAKGSWGFQAGAEEVDLVLLIMNEQGVQKLLDNKVSLGADASVAAGPIGRAGSVATDAQLTAEILSYSRAKGLFAGINLSGGVLRPDEDANHDAYGRDASPRTILATRSISAPPEAQAFLASLGRGVAAPTPTERPAGSQASSTPPSPRATTTPTTDDDIRTQVVEMQQTLGRLLSASSSGAVGTTGTTGSASANTIAVDREQLVQLRRQLDALLDSLNRR